MAVLLVMICHISEQVHPTNSLSRSIKSVAFAGWTGVDLFFVLSGFLITGILWDAKGGNAYFRNFYARRTLRIFPLYYATLAIVFILVPAISPKSAAADGLFSELLLSRHYWAWYGTYFIDLLFALKGFMFAGHFWSLAVEEHFYLVWPLLVHKLARRGLMSLCLALIALAMVLRFTMLVSMFPPVAIYVLTPCRMDGLALGALLALTLRGPNGLELMRRFARVGLAISGVMWITLMWLQHGWSQYGLIPQTVGYLVTEVFYGAVLVFTLTSKRIAAFMSVRPLRLMGKISYALYVFHVFIVILVARFIALGTVSHYSIVFSLMKSIGGAFVPGRFLMLLDSVVYMAVAIGLSVGVALLSWHILELPCLRLKQFFPYAKSYNRPPTVHDQSLARSKC
jgi:peptidoglycan/LPS O-acetylase OafA/YrhL